MIFESNQNVRYIDFDGYPFIHGFSTRLGGVSRGDCAAMNLSFTRGDRPEDVKRKHCLLAEALGYESEQLVLTDQVTVSVCATNIRNFCFPTDIQRERGNLAAVIGLKEPG